MAARLFGFLSKSNDADPAQYPITITTRLGQNTSRAISPRHHHRLVILKTPVPEFSLTTQKQILEIVGPMGIGPALLAEVPEGGIEGVRSAALLIEYVEGADLFDYVSLMKPELKEVKPIFAKLVGMVAEIHHAGIMHRDLKLENVVRTPAGELKIIDWEYSQFIDSCGDTSSGSPVYASPELVSDDAPSIGPHNDIWALGVILFVMSVRSFPVHVKNWPMASHDVATIKNLKEIDRAWRLHEVDFEPPIAQGPPEIQVVLDRIFVPWQERIDASGLAKLVSEWGSV